MDNNNDDDNNTEFDFEALLKETRSVLKSYKTAGGKLFQQTVKAMTAMREHGVTEPLLLIICGADPKDSDRVRFFTGQLFPGAKLKKSTDTSMPYTLSWGSNGPGWKEDVWSILYTASLEGGIRLQNKALYEKIKDLNKTKEQAFDVEKYFQRVWKKLEDEDSIEFFLKNMINKAKTYKSGEPDH